MAIIVIIKRGKKKGFVGGLLFEREYHRYAECVSLEIVASFFT